MQKTFKPIEKLIINTSSRSYPVYIGKEAIKELGPFIKQQFPICEKILIITDDNVVQHEKILINELAGLESIIKIVPAGEQAKTFECYHDCLTTALENKLSRKSLIIAFGGGAVGDLAGFVAATYMRGIPFIQVPTTILAHDSAIGGKVAINHELGKNLIGAFYQPHAVIYDLQFLATLSNLEVRSGFAEIIKEGLIGNKDLYNWIRTNVVNLEALTTSDWQMLLIHAMKVKQDIVEKDETEQSIRAYLNFGHTLGHAIESILGYGKWTHGQAVVLGMIYALKISKELVSLEFDITSFTEWLMQLGYEVDLPNEINKTDLIEKMFLDKKANGQSLNYVLLKEIETAINFPLKKEQLEKLI